MAYTEKYLYDSKLQSKRTVGTGSNCGSNEMVVFLRFGNITIVDVELGTNSEARSEKGPIETNGISLRNWKAG